MLLWESTRRAHRSERELAAHRAPHHGHDGDRGRRVVPWVDAVKATVKPELCGTSAEGLTAVTVAFPSVTPLPA